LNLDKEKYNAEIKVRALKTLRTRSSDIRMVACATWRGPTCSRKLGHLVTLGSDPRTWFKDRNRGFVRGRRWTSARAAQSEDGC